MLSHFTVLLIKERVSKLKYPMLPLNLKMQCIMNRKVCIKCKKLLNERGTTSRNHINLNFLAIMYIYVLITTKIHEILLSSLRGVALKTASVVYLNMAKLWSSKRDKIPPKMKD